MNTKVIWSLLGVAVVLAAVYVVVRPVPATAPAVMTGLDESNATTTSSAPSATPLKGSSEPTFKVGSTTTTTAHISIAFDAPTFNSTSTYPTVTGTANVSKVSIIIYDSTGKGLAGTSDIKVVNGHWSYPISVALAPGRYLLALFGGKASANATLVVSN